MGVNSQPLDGWQQYLDQNREAAERAIVSLGAVGSTGASFDDEQRRRDIESGARVPLPRANIGSGDPLADMLRQRIRATRAAGQSQYEHEQEQATLWPQVKTEAVLALERLRRKNYQGAFEFRVVQGASSGRPTFTTKIGWCLNPTARSGAGTMLATDGNIYTWRWHAANEPGGCYELIPSVGQGLINILRRFAQ